MIMLHTPLVFLYLKTTIVTDNKLLCLKKYFWSFEGFKWGFRKLLTIETFRFCWRKNLKGKEIKSVILLEHFPNHKQRCTMRNANIKTWLERSDEFTLKWCLLSSYWKIHIWVPFLRQTSNDFSWYWVKDRWSKNIAYLKEDSKHSKNMDENEGNLESS